MNGGEHHTDDLIAVLRSPALPREQAGEARAVTAMLDALPTATPTPSTTGRGRRGAVIAAITVAGLGLGGLVAAGPGGLFSPAADQPTTTPAPTTAKTTDDDADDLEPQIIVDDTIEAVDAAEDQAAEVPTSSVDTPRSGASAASAIEVPQAAAPADVECVGETHGDTVSDVARSTPAEPGKGATVSEAARSDCGKADRDDDTTTDDPPAEGDDAADVEEGRSSDGATTRGRSDRSDDDPNGQGGERRADGGQGGRTTSGSDAAQSERGRAATDQGAGAGGQEGGGRGKGGG